MGGVGGFAGRRSFAQLSRSSEVSGVSTSLGGSSAVCRLSTGLGGSRSVCRQRRLTLGLRVCLRLAGRSGSVRRLSRTYWGGGTVGAVFSG